MVCSEIYLLAMEADIRVLSLDVVKMGFERAMLALEPMFNAILEEEVGKKLTVRRVLKKLARGKGVYSQENNPAEVKRAVDLLI